MNELRLAWIVCALALAAPSASAGDFYLGASVGSSSLDLEQGQLNVDTTGYKGLVGYRFLRFLSVELGYSDFGDPSRVIQDVSYEVEARVAALWAIGILPVSPRLDLFGRLGVCSFETELTIGSVSFEEFDGTELAWGFGIAYNATRKVGIVLEWENYEFDNAEESTFTSLGFRYIF